MAHEMTQTIRQQDGMYYNINGYTGKVLQGPFDTVEEAVWRARMRSDMQGEMNQGSMQEAGPLGLGDLESLMYEGAEKWKNTKSPLSPDFDQEPNPMPLDPNPTEWGPLRKDPTDDHLREQDYGIYTAQRRPSHEIPARPGLGRLAQGPQLDPRMQKMMEDAERGKQGGPSQKYFKGQPPPAPQPQAPPAGNPNLPGGGPRPGETEDQYLQRIIRGG